MRNRQSTVSSAVAVRLVKVSFEGSDTAVGIDFRIHDTGEFLGTGENSMTVLYHEPNR
jgi:hypothetical protein